MACPKSFHLPFGGSKNGEVGQTATTTSSATDLASPGGWIDPEQKEAAFIRPTEVQSNVTEEDAEKQAHAKKQWPLWIKVTIAGCVFAIITGLAVGLGVSLSAHKNSGASHGGDGKDGSESPGVGSGNGSGSGSGNSSHKSGQLAVYWGAKPNPIPLDTVCDDPSYDTVNLAFLSYFFGSGQYPRLTIASLNGSSEAQRLAGAVDLQDGTSLVPAIRKCQARGKRVLLSMGGAAGYADVRVADDAQGRQVADTIWNLFLGGGNKPEIRPFGDVVLDGVDFDNESGQSTGYEAMAAQFRTHFASDPRRRYYMTAAPQCPPTADQGELRLFQHLDAVLVQFYNNNVCNVGASGFEASVRHWSAVIGGNTTLLVGALASDADKDEGYVDAGRFAEVMARVKAMKLANYGGVMLWAAELAAANGEYQKKIRSAV
ncbi:hypothetical protein V2A60_008647 [Cordyceps javanica]